MVGIHRPLWVILGPSQVEEMQMSVLRVVLVCAASVVVTTCNAQQSRSSASPTHAELLAVVEKAYQIANAEIHDFKPESDRTLLRSIAEKIRNKGPFTLSQKETEFATLNADRNPLTSFLLSAMRADLAYYIDCGDDVVESRIQEFSYSDNWLWPIMFHELLGRESMPPPVMLLFTDRSRVDHYKTVLRRATIDKNIDSEIAAKLRDEYPFAVNRINDVLDESFTRTREWSRIRQEDGRRYAIAAETNARIEADQALKKEQADFADNSREWTSSDGKFRVQAVFVSYDDSIVVLKKSDLSEISVPISQLSSDDKKFVSSIVRERLSKLRERERQSKLRKANSGR